MLTAVTNGIRPCPSSRHDVLPSKKQLPPPGVYPDARQRVYELVLEFQLGWRGAEPFLSARRLKPEW